MGDQRRVSLLRALIQELERSAPSEERDAVLERTRDRLSALELVWEQPSAWPSRGQGLDFPPMKPRPRRGTVELADVVLD